jgi:N-acetylneuraminic acid mutarotase
MAYDPDADRVIVFGGFAIAGTAWIGGLADTWAYDYNTDTWTEMTPEISPPARHYHALAYDPTIDRVILFGGTDAAERPFDDTWAYDYESNTWTELAPATAPSPRGWHAMAYSEMDQKVVLFGGGPTHTQFLADTWLFDPATNVWSSQP